jgi:hypothetical protein
VDNDRVTDGQEVEHLTVRGEVHQLTGPIAIGQSLGTDPGKPDIDTDGYWDGWYGVYGMDYSEKVVLYRDNLKSGDGIDQNEAFEEQGEIHGADHAKVHVGELHWRDKDASQSPSPTNGNSVPDTSLEVELDYRDTFDQAFINNYEGSIEDTYSAHDMNIEVYQSDSLTGAQLQAVGVTPGESINASKYGTGDPTAIENQSHDDLDRLYLYVGETGTSVASAGGCRNNPLTAFGTFASAGDGTVPAVSMSGTGSHEIGHILGIGCNDDANLRLDEVYSGDDNPNDPTPERLPSGQAEWSIMARDDFRDTDGNIYHFNIEELFTADFHDPELGDG